MCECAPESLWRRPLCQQSRTLCCEPHLIEMNRFLDSGCRRRGAGSVEWQPEDSSFIAYTFARHTHTHGCWISGSLMHLNTSGYTRQQAKQNKTKQKKNQGAQRWCSPPDPPDWAGGGKAEPLASFRYHSLVSTHKLTKGPERKRERGREDRSGRTKQQKHTETHTHA